MCHFWFHPSIDEWFLKNVFPEILKYAAEKRDEGKLWVETMGGIARYCEAREVKSNVLP